MLSCVCVMAACFVRRFQRWQELQRVVLSEEDEEPPMVDLSARGEVMMKQKDEAGYSQIGQGSQRNGKNSGRQTAATVNGKNR